jgi:hypothetical protein
LTIAPSHENLRRAVRWLSEHAPVTTATIDAACIRFDLSPQDEQFLLTHFLERADGSEPPGAAPN